MNEDRKPPFDREASAGLVDEVEVLVEPDRDHGFTRRIRR